jgi:hypothetical protein
LISAIQYMFQALPRLRRSGHLRGATRCCKLRVCVRSIFPLH